MIAPCFLFRNTRRILQRLAANTGGAYIVEFALTLPILILVLTGVFDLAHTQYTRALVNGTMQKAGRDLTLESAPGSQSVIDGRVIAMVRQVVPADATITLQKLSHFDFTDIGQAEQIVEPQDGDTDCDPGESFIDANDNGGYDKNRGQVGIGGARDAVLYTAVVTWPRLFPVHRFTGMSPNVSVRASTVLRNQPFDEQDRSTTTRPCV